MGRSGIKLQDEDFEKHNERRKQLGMTWPEYMDNEAPPPLEAILRRVVREELAVFKDELLDELDGQNNR